MNYRIIYLEAPKYENIEEIKRKFLPTRFKHLSAVVQLTMSNASNNIEFQVHEPFWFTFCHGIIQILGLITNVAALLYIKYKLKINCHIRVILSILAWIKIFLLVEALVGYSMIHIGSIRNIYVCSIFTDPSLCGLLSSNLFPAVISIIRYTGTFVLLPT